MMEPMAESGTNSGAGFPIPVHSVQLTVMTAAVLDEAYRLYCTEMRFLVAISLVAVQALGIPRQKDLGYEKLFITYDEDIEETCYALATKRLPFESGTFVIPSVAKFELAENNFTSVLDGFGKLHAFYLEDGKMCFTSKMIGSGFYNMSIENDKIAPSVLFMDTEPPLSYRAAEILSGPNDNVYVNTAQVGDNLISLTDSQYMLQFSLQDLSIEGLVRFMDTIDATKMSTGSAHAIRRGQCMVDIVPLSDMDGSQPKVVVYELCADGDKFHRKELNSYSTSYIPYMHSFGLTENYAILPHQGFYFNYSAVLKEGKPLVDAIVDISGSTPFVVKVLPLQGGDPITITIEGDPVYYFHVANSFETAADDGSAVVVMDVSVLPFNMLPYFTLEMERTKAIRDAATVGVVVVRRYVLYVSGPRLGDWDSQDLTNPKRSVDFPVFNRAYQSKESCVIYALEWFHDEETYADMAMLKTNACTGETRYWYKENYFPSEPTFVASKTPSAEDDGVLLFTAVHGSQDQSYIFIVDAKTMRTIEEIAIPGTITFTTHGQWYKA